MRLLCLSIAAVVSSGFAAAWAQSPAPSSAGGRAVVSLADGIEVSCGQLHERVTALRVDTLRVRLWRGEKPPEDASWAVLPQARAASSAVTVDSASAHPGFRTAAVSIEIDPETLEITIRDRNGTVLQQDARPVRFDGDAFRIYKTMPLDEHYFGLGDKTGPLDRRNQAFTLWNTDAYLFQESTDPIYKSIPFFLSYRAGRTLGILMDNTWRSSFDFGKESPDAYSFGASGGPIDYYVFYGPSARRVVETYAWLTGTPPLPPLWSLGFQQSRYSYMTQAQVLQVAGRLRSDSIPADAIYLDIDYQNHYRPFTVNRATFPDLSGMIAQLKAEQFHVVMITDLHIAKYPGHDYVPYESGIAGDRFVKNLDGSVYSGSVWPGPSVFPDFTQQQTRAWWGTLYRDFVKDGAAGFWNDMNEPSIFDSDTFTMPLDVIHRIDEPGFAARNATHAEIHNVYGMENSRATYDGLRALQPSVRPFVLTRASYAGGQRFAATWTGDNSSTWNHLRLATPMLENLGLSGFALSGADVGGYAGTPSPQLLTKWFEIAAFQPIDRDHSEKGTADQEPWAGGPDQEDIRRRFVETRYRLLPYLYTLAEEASRTGLPIVRPLFFEFPDAAADRHPIDLDKEAAGEFLVGPDLLVAAPPYPDQAGAYAAELPSPGWYDFWTGKKLAPPSADAADPPNVPGRLELPTVEITPNLAQLPVFVRPGTILPMEPLVESTDQTPKGPLTLRIYVGDSCAGTLYQDDGKSFSYRNGEYLKMNFSCRIDGDALRVEIGAHEGTFPAWWKAIRAEVYGWSPKNGIATVDSGKAQLHVNRQGEEFDLSVPDDGRGVVIGIR